MIQFISLISTIFFSIMATAQAGAGHWNIEKGSPLQGYDAVSYHTQHKAVKGDSRFVVSHRGVEWYFSSAANKEAFKKNPAAYEPAYGGWCAFAMGDYGKKVEVDPETFKLIDGKLYLFYNKYFNNTLVSWNKNESVLKTQGDANWEKIIR